MTTIKFELGKYVGDNVSIDELRRCSSIFTNSYLCVEDKKSKHIGIVESIGESFLTMTDVIIVKEDGPIVLKKEGIYLDEETKIFLPNEDCITRIIHFKANRVIKSIDETLEHFLAIKGEIYFEERLKEFCKEFNMDEYDLKDYLVKRHNEEETSSILGRANLSTAP